MRIAGVRKGRTGAKGGVKSETLPPLWGGEGDKAQSANPPPLLLSSPQVQRLLARDPGPASASKREEKYMYGLVTARPPPPMWYGPGTAKSPPQMLYGPGKAHPPPCRKAAPLVFHKECYRKSNGFVDLNNTSRMMTASGSRPTIWGFGAWPGGMRRAIRIRMTT